MAVVALCGSPAATAHFDVGWQPCDAADRCNLRILLWIDCQDGLRSQPEPPTFEVGITSEVGGVEVDGPRNITMDTAPCLTDPWGNATGSGDYDIQVDLATAPGETPFKITFAFARSLGLAPQSGWTNMGGGFEVLWTVKYRGDIRVEPLQEIGYARPGEDIRYDLKVTNLGNSQSYLSFELVGEVPPGWLAQAPIPTTVQSLQQGASTNEITVPLIVRASAEGATDFALRVTASSTRTGEPAPPVEVTVRAEVRSASAPAADVPLVLLLAGLCAVLQRAWRARRG
jgi:hypothetical protein